ncbi:acyl-CoA thioesterase [Aspergillus lucknowensis]|uniref:Capsule polysaccharide biosynthesis protein n=1 Tax=Aspergillus lucknowensis TaxID=176173 RepID=A0ABR4LHQ7_9EURO
MALSPSVETLLNTVWESISLTHLLTGAGVLFLFLNAKGLPGVWHYRLFKSLFIELVWKRSTAPAPLLDSQGRPRLYSYFVTECSNPVIECDYNLHKSNSTFFSDLDINRTQLMIAHFKHVLSTASFPGKTRTANGNGNEQESKRPLMMALGGVSCLFHREIKPLQRYEIWSRVLAWDEKWVYVVSYFVKKGSLGRDGNFSGDLDLDPKGNAKAVLASCMARYVFKEGRLTVMPERVLQECGLLPLPEDVVVEKASADSWGKEQFEEARQKGMVIAGKFSGLEVLPLVTGFRESGVLGRYTDF